MCYPGEICPSGSSTVTSCTPGKYCKDYASGLTSGNCEAGYYCPIGDPQTSKNPRKYVCPPGSYCPEGSTTPTSCPAGTYSPSLGGSLSSHCLACPAGLVCSGSNA